MDLDLPADLHPQMSEIDLIAAARRGDETAFERVIEPYRRELLAHCYRMLGSIHDAEDALQEAMLRAWRGLAKFEGRSSLRSWLYRIATNSSLRLIERRPARVLPIDHGPPGDPHGDIPPPLIESTWIEPFPDEGLRYEERETVELAFTAALQHLPPLQRAALILTDVLGYAPGEVAETLEQSPASIYSALQRARKAAEEKLPELSQQETLRTLGDDAVRETVERFAAAWERADVDAIREMLVEDAVVTMPPWALWFRGREDAADFLLRRPLRAEHRWRMLPTSASGQPALAGYTSTDESPLRFADVLVLTFAPDGRIAELTAFRDPKLSSKFDLPDAMDSE
jgi:RNA polymerase sigma-70 factor (ECF subfamily)